MRRILAVTFESLAAHQAHFHHRYKGFLHSKFLNHKTLVGFLRLPLGIAGGTASVENSSVGQCNILHPGNIFQLGFYSPDLISHFTASGERDDLIAPEAWVLAMEVIELLRDNQGSDDERNRKNKLNGHQNMPESSITDAEIEFTFQSLQGLE